MFIIQISWSGMWKVEAFHRTMNQPHLRSISQKTAPAAQFPPASFSSQIVQKFKIFSDIWLDEQEGIITVKFLVSSFIFVWVFLPLFDINFSLTCGNILLPFIRNLAIGEKNNLGILKRFYCVEVYGAGGEHSYSPSKCKYRFYTDLQWLEMWWQV